MAHKVWIARSDDLFLSGLVVFRREPQYTHGRDTARKAWRARGKRAWLSKYVLKDLGIPIPAEGECVEVTVKPGRTWVPRG